MKTRLKACERWHPTSPSRIYVVERTNGMGAIYRTHICNACKNIQKRFWRAGVAYPARLVPKPRVGIRNQLYGVLPRLNWAPPQL